MFRIHVPPGKCKYKQNVEEHYVYYMQITFK